MLMRFGIPPKPCDVEEKFAIQVFLFFSFFVSRVLPKHSIGSSCLPPPQKNLCRDSPPRQKTLELYGQF